MPRIYYITQSGRLRRKDNTIYLELIDKTYQSENNEVDNIQKIEAEESSDEKLPIRKIPVPIEDIDSIYIYGEIDLNTKLLNFLSQHQIPIHVFNYYGYYSGTYYPREYLVSGFLTVKQAQHYDRPSKRILIAREIVSSAVDNMLKNLRYYNNREKDCSEQIKTIENLSSQIPLATNINELMGIEGNVRETYYSALNIILDTKTLFEKRVRHPPDNPINAIISFGNSMIYTACLTEIYRTQLNPTISFLHEPGNRRFSLSLDLAEIFKPIIIDRMIFRLINRHQIQEDKHFAKELDGCYLNDEGRKIFIQEFDKQLKTTIEHRRLNRKVSYQRLIRLECYKLIKHLMEMEPYIAYRA